jgi:hypothetical protein
MSPLDVIDLVRKLISLVLDLVPKDVATQLLTEEAVRRQNAIANAAEAVKFGVVPLAMDDE